MSKKDFLEEVDEGVDVTPLIDIVFQLIIFFMVVGKMVSEDVIKIELPMSEVAVDMPADPTKLIINLDAKGGCVIYGERFENVSQIQSLMRKVAQQVRQNTGKGPDEPLDVPVLLRIDRNTEYEHVRILLYNCAVFKLWNTKWTANNPNL